MSQQCRAEAHSRARRVVRDLERLDAVDGADVLDPTQHPVGRWTVAVLLVDEFAPAAVLDTLADHDCALDPCTAPQGSRLQVVASV